MRRSTHTGPTHRSAPTRWNECGDILSPFPPILFVGATLAVARSRTSAPANMAPPLGELAWPQAVTERAVRFRPSQSPAGGTFPLKRGRLETTKTPPCITVVMHGGVCFLYSRPLVCAMISATMSSTSFPSQGMVTSAAASYRGMRSSYTCRRVSPGPMATPRTSRFVRRDSMVG